MNNETILSIPVSVDLSSHSNVAVKLTSTGLALAGAGDRAIGVMLRGNDYPANGQSAVGQVAAVKLNAGIGLYDVTLANNVAIVMGDELEQWPNGRYAKRGSVITGTGETDDDLITITGHGLTAGTPLICVTATSGTGLTVGVTYYVHATGLTANAFSVATTAAGSVVNISADYTVLSFRLATSGGLAGVAFQAVPVTSIGGVFEAILFNSSPERGQGVLQVATTLTAADSGKTFFLAGADGAGTAAAITLPAPAPGLRFNFFVKVAPAGDYTIVTASAAQVLCGLVHSSDGVDGDSETALTGTTITFVSAGGASTVGDNCELFSDGYGWYARVFCNISTGATITG